MELRRTATALLRPRVTPLICLASSSIPARWQNTSHMSQLGSTSLRSGQFRRAITNTSSNQAVRPSITTSASSPDSSNSPSSPNNTSKEPQEPVNWFSRTSRPGSTVRHDAESNSPDPYQDPYKIALTPERESSLNGGSSALDLMAAYNENIKLRPNFYSSSASSSGTRSGIDTSRMKSPTAERAGSATLTSMMSDVGSFIAMPAPVRVPMRLNASTGRTIDVGAMRIDLARGIRLMEMSCARNRIKADAQKQRFHERPGLKRKRLRRERWRKRFAEGFKGVLGRVKELKKQGW